MGRIQPSCQLRTMWLALRKAWQRLVNLATVEDGQAELPLEQPWLKPRHWPASRLAGPGFSALDYRLARQRAIEVARLTLGEEVWAQFQRQHYLDVPSARFPGVTYRLRVGRRIEVRRAAGAEAPWSDRFLCLNPTYPLPEVEFFAHLYLYVRDQEDEVIRVAVPQRWDQPLAR